MLTRFLTVISVIALAVVFAAPVAAQTESAPSLTQALTGCTLDDLETYAPVSDEGVPIRNWVELHGLGWQILNASVAEDAPTVTYILPPGEDTRMDIHHGSLWQGECESTQFDYVGTAIASFVLGDESHSGLVVDAATCTLYDVTLTEGVAVTTERAEFIDLTLASQRVNQNVVPCLTMSAADATVFVTGS